MAISRHFVKAVLKLTNLAELFQIWTDNLFRLINAQNKRDTI